MTLSAWKKAGVAAVFVLTLVSAVNAGAFEDGMEALKHGDYNTANRLMRPLAEQGDAKAQNKLGQMFALGRGVRRDYSEAVYWYRKAAEQGVAEAQFSLGFMYEMGRGVPRDYVAAHKWLDLAATAGIYNAARFRDIVAKRMAISRITEARRLAHEWRPTN